MSRDPRWRTYLDADERVLWTGRPGYYLQFRAEDLLAIPLGVLAALIGAAIVRADGYAFSNLAIGLPLIGIGIFVVFGRYLRMMLDRLTTTYVLTDRRAMIVRRLSVDHLYEIPVQPGTPVEVTFGHRGHIWLGPRPAWIAVTEDDVIPAEHSDFQFVAIANPAAVHRLIRRIQRGEAT